MRHENVERMETCGTVVVIPETVEEMQHLALVNRLKVCRAEPEVTDLQCFSLALSWKTCSPPLQQK